MRYFLLISVFLIFSKYRASHVMGGEITYECVGNNQYVFELVFYRDCNGAEVNIVSENIRVWNHPSVQNINLLFVSREDISPVCTSVAGGPTQLECGNGSAGGNGVGAIEKITYRSIPTTLNGIPPVQGWIFTYENFSRSSSITNLNSPSSYGITLAAKIYAVPGADGSGCTDSSPKFLQEPNFVSCAGSPYVYNMNAIDPDLDSLVFEFGIPYNYFPDATAYNPPNEPIPVPFENGFSYNNPTPDQSLDALNIPSSLDNSSGELSFFCNNIGNYVVKISVKSYRNGTLISEVEREMQLVVSSCSAPNNPPIINAPFANNQFDTTIIAGQPITFSLDAIDSDLLQDGSAQDLILTVSGQMFGSNFTLDTGCGIEPCAQLNQGLPFISTSTMGVEFNWQTSCDHLVNQYGIVADVVPYHFVFKVQDNMCQVPKISYATVTINLQNPGVISETQIECIQTNATGEITVYYNSVDDINSSFVSYSISSIQGLNNTNSDINSTFETFPAINSVNDFFIGVTSGCEGNTQRFSDTVKNIYLDLINPSNGTAVLQWNTPYNSSFFDSTLYYYVFREYPENTLSLIDSVPYGTNQYIDTIDICDAEIGYQIHLPTNYCEFTSNIMSDQFQDLITPDIPLIYAVGTDTSNLNNVLIEWNQNSQNDTYGYIVYTFDENGFLFELDTVWGVENTSYSYTQDITGESYSYSIAAFDSCLTPSMPPTYQTSAKAYLNSTMLLASSVQMCDKKVELNWTGYQGRNPIDYSIWSLSNNQWTNHQIVNDTFAIIDVENGISYCFLISANFQDGFSAFSASTCFTVPNPDNPDFHYLRVSSVQNDEVVLNDYIDASVGVSAVVFERRVHMTGVFKEIGQSILSGNTTTFVDNTADVQNYSYQYRAKHIDSCGNLNSVYSNTNRTILLKGNANQYDLENMIDWNRYEGFMEGVGTYKIYRTFNGLFSEGPIAIFNNLNNDEAFSFEEKLDSLNANIHSEFINDYTNGAICYKIIAFENEENQFGFLDSAMSNDLCLNYKPLVFIPNAFTPNGMNPIFLPVITNVSEKNYSFSILNRWGEEFFHTTDILEGWDGIVPNSNLEAPNDLYIYLINFEDQDGNKYFRKGMVSLLR